MPSKIGNLTTFNLEEIAEAHHISLRSLREKCRRGIIAGRKHGSRWFVTEDALKKYFETGNQRKPETAA